MPIERRPPAEDGLFIVGLVGRAGSGKSTVAAALAEAGALVIEADRLGHEVTDRDPEVRATLEEEYGRDVYRSDGTLDRARVAERVFSDAGARARLDALVHPRILEAIRARLRALREEGWTGVVVIDAALLLKWGLERDCDAILAVTAPEESQVKRLMAARGWSEAAARARLAAQWENERYAAAADRTIDNRGTRDALASAAREAIATLRKGARC